MDLVDFPTWWADFFRDPCAHDQYDGVKRLCGYIDDLTESSRGAFLANLLDVAIERRDGWHLAWRTLKERHDAATCARVAPVARTLLETLTPLDALPRPFPQKAHDDREALGYCLCILACSPNDDHLAMVERFLLHGEMGGPFSYRDRVTGWLWPRNPGLYSRAWCRYFSETPVEVWRDRKNVQQFLSSLDKLACVRDRMIVDAPSRWRDLRASVLRLAASPAVSEDVRRGVASVCGDTD